MSYPNRAVRMSDHIWAAVTQRAGMDGTNPSVVVRTAVCEYVSRPPARPVQRKAGKRVVAPPGKPLDALGEPCNHPEDRQVKGICTACGRSPAGGDV